MAVNRFDTYVGIDLGGARGKTTAVATLRRDGDEVSVETVLARYADQQPWYDPLVADYAGELEGRVSIAINAPLTMPACVRCQLAACPGVEACVDPAVTWLRSEGAAIVDHALERDLDRIVAIPSGRAINRTERAAPVARPRIVPYVQRCTEIELGYGRGTLPLDCTGGATGPIAARATHLTRLLRSRGFTLHDSLLEVSPRATVHVLFGADAAKGYKRDADPWHTRAKIVDHLDDLRFSPTSRLSREEVLRNDHCFEALLSAYTAYLCDRDGWELPAGPFADDGYIFTP